MRNKDNPRVFMDLSIDGTAAGRLVIELYKDQRPKAAENFRALCTGEMGIGITTGKPLHYKGSQIYYIHDGAFAEGVDFQNNDGSGGESIYGGFFRAERYKPLPPKRGMLYMAHSHSKNGSMFIIIFSQLSFVRRYAVVGCVIQGMDTLDKIEPLGTPRGQPTRPVMITDCGEVSQGEKTITGKRAMSSDESCDGPVKKQREST
ncbi:peptidyl-prolyl cis-trans isomerase CYP19-2-like [Bidens hawaiensis]|uniref:peptidyl-prolyl cis-trans isomerase CYP19-2-like n=1 Tax=Bidens hawaiensis TaxID=980011 RepID=UPI00404AE6FA